jgi:hypothetical protein
MADKSNVGAFNSKTGHQGISGNCSTIRRADTSQSTRISRNGLKQIAPNGVRKTETINADHVEPARTLPAFTEQLMPFTVTDFTSTYL